MNLPDTRETTLLCLAPEGADQAGESRQRALSMASVSWRIQAMTVRGVTQPEKRPSQAQHQFDVLYCRAAGTLA